MSFINVLFKRVTTAIRGTEAIQDGKILLDYERPSIYVDNGSTRVELTPRDTALSTTSTNAIANNALTNSIINTTAEVSAITADNIPCGTKPVKELITNLNALEDNLPFIQPVQVRAFGSFSNATWTATEDCVIVGSFYQPASSTGGSVSIAGVSIGVRTASTESNFPIYIPIKQGQVFGIGSVGAFNGGAYKLYGR